MVVCRKDQRINLTLVESYQVAELDGQWKVLFSMASGRLEIWACDSEAESQELIQSIDKITGKMYEKKTGTVLDFLQ